MPELDIADAEGTLRGDTILVSVAPPDGVAVAAALREGGFVVTEAPLHLLAVRALAEIPRVMIVDVDVPGAMEAIERAREVAPAELVCVGDPVRAAELGAHQADGRVFLRPIDLGGLVMSVLTVAEPAGPPRSRGTLPPSIARPRETSPPRRSDSEAPPASEYPSASDPLDLAVLLPTLDEAEGTAMLAPIELSPELSHILEAAEQRVSALGEPHPSSIPSPEEELDLLLPPEMLAPLDEPLDPDDDGSASGASTGGTGAPRARTGGETGATGATGATTGAFTDRGTSTVDAGRGARPSTHPTMAGMGPFTDPAPVAGAAVPPATGVQFGGRSPATTTPGASVREPEPLPPQRPAAPEPRAPRIGVVPIPIESLPDRPIPDPGAGATDPGNPRPSTPPVAAPPPSAGASGESPRFPTQPAPPGTVPPPRPPTAPAPPMTAVDSRLEPQPQVQIPAVLGDGDAVRALSAAIAGRLSGSLALGPDATTRRVVLHEGDIVTAASGSADETLIAFLAARGDLVRSEAARLQSRLPAHGRHAGAALIAHGHLGQDDLWPVLRAHAEWIIGRALLCDEGTCELEPEPPGRLKAEPSVFGGAAGAEVLLEEIRRVIPPADALRRLGGPTARLAEGPRRQLLVESALRPEDERVVRGAAGRTVGEVLAEAEPELADVLYGLVSLGVLEALAPVAPAESAAAAFDPLDEEALRQRVRARVALVEDGDYFSLLGVAPSATGYEIKRAYLELRRAFEPGRVLTAATADLADDVRLVVEVLDEAYEILREPHRRERYRRALEAGPP